MCEGRWNRADFPSEGGFVEGVFVGQLVLGGRRKRLDPEMIGPEDGGKIRLADIVLNRKSVQRRCVRD